MIAKQITTILRDNPGLKALEITRKVSLDKPKVNADNYPTHVVNYWMNNSVRVAQKHYLQITDDHHLAGCGIASESKAVSPAASNPTLSETVALLIDRWSSMTPRQKDWLSSWLQP